MTNPYPGDDADRTTAYSRGYPQGAAPQQGYPTGGRPQQPAAGQARPAGQQSGPQEVGGVRIQQFLAGIFATALVAAVFGFVATAVIQAIYTNHAPGAMWVDGEQSPWIAALIGGVGAIVAGLLLWFFLALVPSPMVFFQWIVGLIIVAAVVLPLVNSAHWQSGVITAIINALMGVLVLSLLSTVGHRTAPAALAR